MSVTDSTISYQEIDSVQDVTANRKRDTTLKPQLTLNRNQGKKLVVEYNDKGKLMGEASMELTSYLGFLGRTMVPMVYEDWHQVPDELKENLWDCVQWRRPKSFWMHILLVRYEVVPRHLLVDLYLEYSSQSALICRTNR